jgi:NAD(P)H-hydrate epimerase
MLEILTAEQSKQADALTISGGVPGIKLMEAAGAAVARAIIDKFEPRGVLVLCGPGNNGGDGFVAARALKKAGWAVRLACLVKKNTLKGDAALAAKEWDGETEALNSNLSLKDSGLVIDAVFGTGFHDALAPEIITLFDKIRAKKVPVIAVDIPSGVDAAGALKADITVTFTRRKLAHTLYPSKAMCGAVHVAQIGVTDETIAMTGARIFENHPALWASDFPLPSPTFNKYDRGHVFVAGGAERTGAACLAAHAAQKIGAGVVSIACPKESASVYRSYRASLMVDAWGNLEDFKSTLRDPRKNTIVLGPGLGHDMKEYTDAALSFGKGGVLDADIFTIYKSNPQELFEKISEKYLLTPHEGEFARLFPDLAGSKVERALAAAKLSKAIVLLKGPDTVIAAPDGTAIINTWAPPTLATAGSGDVLAGFIGGLIAQKMPPFMAAAAASWLHADAAGKYGYGLTAEDIISSLNQSLNGLFGVTSPDM